MKLHMRSDRKSSNTKHRPPATFLQRLAGQRNWFKGFICKNINLASGSGILYHSHNTLLQLEKVNYEMGILRDCIDKDWKDQKASVKRDEKKIASFDSINKL